MGKRVNCALFFESKSAKRFQCTVIRHRALRLGRVHERRNPNREIARAGEMEGDCGGVNSWAYERTKEYSVWRA